MHCVLSQAEVQEAFLAAPPAIAKQIYNKTVKIPNWIRDMYQLQEFARGQGTTEQQLTFRGEMPPIERGFDKWKMLGNNTGCEPCEGPGCGYNWTTFAGTGIQTKIMQMMERDFRSMPYCIKEIQTTAHYEQIFAQTVQNLFMQINFFKEMNIGFNYFTMLLKKYLVDSGGPKPNTQNPYVYRPKGDTVRVSMLNIEMLQFFYEYMRRLPDAIPFDVSDGNPLFALVCSSQLQQRLYRDDPTLRQDIRFSGLANDLVKKYNFMSTVQGMFLPVPILYPRRFRYDTTADDWVEILPFETNVPLEVGTYTAFNPNYENPAIATHEEVAIHGKYPFMIKYMPTATTLGQNTSFGPEYSFMNSWQWVNPMTMEDPMRRVGQFVTAATIGLAPQYSEAMFGILVERPKVELTAMWLPEAACPPDPVDCDNEVPDVLCPCPLILSSAINPINDNVVLTLAVPLDPVPDPSDTINFGIDTGGFLVGTVVDAAEDGSAVEVTFPEGTDLGICDHFTSIFCDNTLACSSQVQSYEVNCTDSTRLDLVLEVPIKADTAADVVTLTYGDGTTQSATVVSVDMSTLTWVVDIGGTAFCDNVGGVVFICVPTATDASCPACGGPSYTQCET